MYKDTALKSESHSSVSVLLKNSAVHISFTWDLGCDAFLYI